MSRFHDIETDEAQLREWLRAAGYSSEDASDLFESGFRALPVEELDMKLWASVTAGSTFNRFSEITRWENFAELPRVTPYLICDSYYQEFFPAWPVRDLALYGDRGINPLSPTPGLSQCRDIRVRHRKIPAYVVRSMEDLEELDRSARELYGSDILPLYRGQNNQYSLRRSNSVVRMLFGSEDPVIEPSLLSQATSAGVDGDELLGRMHLELQDMLYNPATFKGSAAMFALRLASGLDLPPSQTPRSPSEHDAYWSHYGSGGLVREVMALTQHYGLPTYGLDLTENHEVAVWFALHRLEEISDQRYRYRAYMWSEGEPENWPCVYLFTVDRLQRGNFTIPDLVALPAERPKRQQAFLSFGGWGWHLNYAAEELRAVAYLAPSVMAHSLPEGRFLFPQADEDPFYAEIVERKLRSVDDPTSVWAYLPLLEA